MWRIKFVLIGIILLFLAGNCWAAPRKRIIDSAKKALLKQPDSVKVKTFIWLGDEYMDSDNELALSNYLAALKLAETIQNKQLIFLSLYNTSLFYERLFRHETALSFAERAQKIAALQANKQNIYDALKLLGLIYFNEQKPGQALPYTEKMVKVAQALGDKEKILEATMAVGDAYRAKGEGEKSFTIYSKALAMAQQIGDKQNTCACIHNIGLIYTYPGHFDKALYYFLKAYNEAKKDTVPTAFYANQLSEAYLNLNRYDEALLYAQKSLNELGVGGDKEQLLYDYADLREIYVKKQNYKEAYHYFTKYTALKDSLGSVEVQNKMGLLQTRYDDEKQTKAIEFVQKQADLQSKLKNVLIGASVLLLIVVFLIANRYRIEKRSEAALSAKNNELNHTITNLKSTQAQLIQSEKMASLGELTAGIAHEIQNPLNFVNNFSEVNREMLQELRAESKKPKSERDDQLEIELIDDLIGNEEKINHHGKRADFIVKGMLQHSRSSTGERQLTNLNTLADEFFKLSYQGLRAKDKSFNAEMVTRFDPALPKIEIVAQDIGRVLLNLFNNAFYAVNEKSKTAGANYKPTVEVATEFYTPPAGGRGVVVYVKDNGIGIPDAIKDKIMQPFFTTKPTGEGTGLGLSLTYDMVVKGHGGSIQVNTKEGEFTKFTVYLPIQS